jgi:hypothetical protein
MNNPNVRSEVTPLECDVLLDNVLDAIGDRTKEWQIIVSFLHPSGPVADVFTTHTIATIWSLGDGNGNHSSQDLTDKGLMFDFSHIRDSSPKGLKRILGGIARALRGRKVLK